MKHSDYLFLTSYFPSSFWKKRTGLRLASGQNLWRVRAGEGFLLAKEWVIRRPVLITQAFTSGIYVAQHLCRVKTDPANKTISYFKLAS